MAKDSRLQIVEYLRIDVEIVTPTGFDCQKFWRIHLQIITLEVQKENL